jgi:hypothetical protein
MAQKYNIKMQGLSSIKINGISWFVAKAYIKGYVDYGCIVTITKAATEKEKKEHKNERA